MCSLMMQDSVLSAPHANLYNTAVLPTQEKDRQAADRTRQRQQCFFLTSHLAQCQPLSVLRAWDLSWKGISGKGKNSLKTFQKGLHRTLRTAGTAWNDLSVTLVASGMLPPPRSWTARSPDLGVQGRYLGGTTQENCLHV